MNVLERHKTLAELQEEDEHLETEVSIARKRAVIRELNRQAG